jgi:hypothetical protein
MSQYSPDKWEIIKIKNGTTIVHKILGNWSGSYLEGRSWRISSGVIGVREEGNFYLFENYSGSIYKCHKSMKTLGLMTADIYNKIQEETKELPEANVEIISVDQLIKEINGNFS